MVEAITQGLFGNMLNTFLKGIIITTNTITGPISALISTLFPNMDSAITYFNYFVTHYVGSTISWFASILPPITHMVLGIWITFLIAYYTIVWTYTGIMKVFNIIQKLKVW